MFEYSTVIFRNKKTRNHKIMKNNKLKLNLQSNLNIFEK